MKKEFIWVSMLVFLIAPSVAVENLSVYDDTVNSDSRVSMKVNSSSGPAQLVIDIDRNQKFNSDSDKHALANWTTGTNNSIYYRDFYGPFPENASGEYRIYAVNKNILEDGLDLSGFENVTAKVENIRPTIYNQSLERNGLNFTYTFSSSEEIWSIFAPVNLNHTGHKNIYYKKLLADDFTEISNNTFRTNFTVDYDGNYSVHVNEAIDYHENVGRSNITEKFRVTSVPPIIENPNPENNSKINSSTSVKLSVYDRGSRISEESLEVTVQNSRKKVVERANTSTTGIKFRDRELEIYPEALDFNITTGVTQIKVYAEDIHGNSAKTYLEYQGTRKSKGFLSTIFNPISEIFSSLLN